MVGGTGTVVSRCWEPWKGVMDTRSCHVILSDLVLSWKFPKLNVYQNKKFKALGPCFWRTTPRAEEKIFLKTRAQALVSKDIVGAAPLGPGGRGRLGRKVHWGEPGIWDSSSWEHSPISEESWEAEENFWKPQVIKIRSRAHQVGGPCESFSPGLRPEMLQPKTREKLSRQLSFHHLSLRG